MLLRQIKSESYGVLRYKPFHPSLSANKKRKPIWFPFFCLVRVRLGNSWFQVRLL